MNLQFRCLSARTHKHQSKGTDRIHSDRLGSRVKCGNADGWMVVGLNNAHIDEETLLKSIAPILIGFEINDYLFLFSQQICLAVHMNAQLTLEKDICMQISV